MAHLKKLMHSSSIVSAIIFLWDFTSDQCKCQTEIDRVTFQTQQKKRARNDQEVDE